MWRGVEGGGDVVWHGLSAVYFDDGKDKVIGFVDGCQYLVLGDGDCIGSFDAPLDFDEAQFAGAGNARFDVIAAFVGAHIAGDVAKLSLCLHHGCHGDAFDTGSFVGGLVYVWGVDAPGEFVDQSLRDDEDTTDDDGRQG